MKMCCEFSGQPSQSSGKKKGIVLICLTLCLQIPSNEPQQKNLLSASQFFSLIDIKRKLINSDNHKFHQYQ